MHRSEKIYLPLAAAHLENGNPHWIYAAKERWSLAMPDSGPMQHNLLQETLKEGGGIPKQEIPLSS